MVLVLWLFWNKAKYLVWFKYILSQLVKPKTLVQIFSIYFSILASRFIKLAKWRSRLKHKIHHYELVGNMKSYKRDILRKLKEGLRLYNNFK